MASHRVIEDSDDEDVDDFCGGSVNKFDAIFAQLNNQKEVFVKQRTEEVKIMQKESEKKLLAKKKKAESASVPKKTELSKEEKLEKVRQERDSKKDLDELRLLDDIDDLLNKKPSVSADIPEIDLADADTPVASSEIPAKKVKRKTRSRKGQPRVPEPTNIPVIEVEDSVTLSDTEDGIDPIDSLTPTKFASIQVTWRDKTFMYSMNLYSKMSVLRQRVSKSTDVRPEDILLFLGEEILYDDKTLLEYDIKRNDTLEALLASSTDLSGGHDPALIKLKCQTQNRRQNFFVHIRKTTCLKQLKTDIAKKLGVAEENVKLQFDGEPLNLEGTAESEGLENEECIDVFA